MDWYEENPHCKECDCEFSDEELALTLEVTCKGCGTSYLVSVMTMYHLDEKGGE